MWFKPNFIKVQHFGLGMRGRDGRWDDGCGLNTISNPRFRRRPDKVSPLNQLNSS